MRRPRVTAAGTWRGIALLSLLVLSLGPLLWMLVQSITSDEDRALGVPLWSIQPTLDAYAAVLDSQFLVWAQNTLIVVAGTVGLVLVSSYLAGYSLAYLPVPG